MPLNEKWGKSRSTSGKGKWAYTNVGTGGVAEPGKTASAAAMSPILKAGETADLKAAAVKGSGTLTFDVRVANDALEGESPEAADGAAKTVLTLLDGKKELLAWTNETDWTSASYTVEEAKATNHAFTWQVVQGVDTNAHAYVANVVWSPAGTEIRAITLAAASYIGGEPCDDPNAGGGVSGGGVYPDKTKTSLAATTKVGWEFVGWARGGHAGRVTLPGQVSLTVIAAGKVSGKVLGDELTYTLAAPYYSGFELADGVAMGGPSSVSAEGADATERVPPSWTAWQYNWKVDPWKTLGKTFDKKTLAYAILPDGSFSDAEDVLTSALGADVPARVTLKFAASGVVSVAGEFVTGYDEKKQKYTTVKASGSATLVPVDDDHGEVFIYLTPKGLAPHARCLDVPWSQE